MVHWMEEGLTENMKWKWRKRKSKEKTGRQKVRRQKPLKVFSSLQKFYIFSCVVWFSPSLVMSQLRLAQDNARKI